MPQTVRDRADALGTLRFASVYLMETLARWVPTSPELEAKLLFGKHIWDFAQHADQLGRRTHELRAALHFTREPRPEYLALLKDLAATEETGDRVAGFYQVILPDLSNRYRSYLTTTDPLLDEPSVRVVERVLNDLERVQEEYRAFTNDRPDVKATDTAQDALSTRVAAITDWVVPRAAPPATAGAGA